MAVPALPFFSFWLCDPETGQRLPHGAITRALSDHFGVQTRSGCACAGPYGHRIFGIEADESAAIRDRIRAGDDTARPGFTRFNLSALMTDDKADAVLAAISAIAREPARYLPKTDLSQGRAMQAAE